MGKKKDKVIFDATRDDERALVGLMKNKYEKVMIRNKTFKVRWMHLAVCDWISDLMTRKGNDNKVLCQCAALIALNGFWKCHMFYWIVWRWYYYIRQYNAGELVPLFQMAQKKTAREEAEAYLNCTILLTALMTTKKQMTKEEADRTLRALRTDKGGKSAPSTESAPSRSSS